MVRSRGSPLKSGATISSHSTAGASQAWNATEVPSFFEQDPSSSSLGNEEQTSPPRSHTRPSSPPSSSSGPYRSPESRTTSVVPPPPSCRLPRLPPSHKSPWTHGTSSQIHMDINQEEEEDTSLRGMHLLEEKKEGDENVVNGQTSTMPRPRPLHQHQRQGSHGEQLVQALDQAIISPLRRWSGQFMTEPEETPLLRRPLVDLDPSTSSDEEPPVPPKPNPRVQQAWNTLRAKVTSGDYLLQASSSLEERECAHQLLQHEAESQQSQQRSLSSFWRTMGSTMTLGSGSWDSHGSNNTPNHKRPSLLFTQQMSSLSVLSHRPSWITPASPALPDNNHNPPCLEDGSSTRTFHSHLTQSQLIRKRQETQDRIRHGLEFTLGHCIAVMALYMLVSVVAFSFVFENWSLIDSMYFALVTCSTIGYGDLTPTSAAGRLFTCAYALSGVCFLGIALGILGNHIVETQELAVEQTSTVAKKRLLSLFAPPETTQVAPEQSQTQSSHTNTRTHEHRQTMQQEQDLFARDPDVVAQAVPGVDPKLILHEPDPPTSRTQAATEAVARKTNPLWRLLVHFGLVMFLLAIFATLMVQDPGVEEATATGNLGSLDYLDAIYFSIVTATTVGYGDYSPVTQQGRLLAIFFIPLAVGAMGHFLSSVAEAIMDSRAQSVRTQLMAQELSPADLEIMDFDGDGKVTRAEFLEYMLVALNKVDKDFIDEMRQHFERLDVDGTGSLSKNDLIEQARKKLQRIHYKLELSSYKKQLLQKAAAARAHQRRRSGNLWGVVASPMEQGGRQAFRSLARMVQSTRNFSIFTGGSPVFGDEDDETDDSEDERAPFQGGNHNTSASWSHPNYQSDQQPLQQERKPSVSSRYMRNFDHRTAVSLEEDSNEDQTSSSSENDYPQQNRYIHRTNYGTTSNIHHGYADDPHDDNASINSFTSVIHHHEEHEHEIP